MCIFAHSSYITQWHQQYIHCGQSMVLQTGTTNMMVSSTSFKQGRIEIVSNTSFILKFCPVYCLVLLNTDHQCLSEPGLTTLTVHSVYQYEIKAVCCDLFQTKDSLATTFFTEEMAGNLLSFVHTSKFKLDVFHLRSQ